MKPKRKKQCFRVIANTYGVNTHDEKDVSQNFTMSLLSLVLSQKHDSFARRLLLSCAFVITGKCLSAASEKKRATTIGNIIFKSENR